MIYKIVISFFLISISFANFKIGYDLSYEIDGNATLVLTISQITGYPGPQLAPQQSSLSDDLDGTLFLGYESIFNSSTGYGLEYVLETDLDDIGDIPIYPEAIDMFSVYGIYYNQVNNESAILLKYGYSATSLKNDSGVYYYDGVGFDYNWESDGGLMLGLTFEHKNFQFSYTKHDGEISGRIKDTAGISNIDFNYDFEISRINIAMLF